MVKLDIITERKIFGHYNQFSFKFYTVFLHILYRLSTDYLQTVDSISKNYLNLQNILSKL